MSHTRKISQISNNVHSDGILFKCKNELHFCNNCILKHLLQTLHKMLHTVIFGLFQQVV